MRQQSDERSSPGIRTASNSQSRNFNQSLVTSAATSFEELGQVGAAHEIVVAFARRATTFVEGPDDQALAATAVAGGEDAFEARRVLVVVGFGVGARVAFDTEL